MKTLFAVAIITAGIAIASTGAVAQERLADGAIGAVAGVLVGGPVGAVAGGVIGHTAGPNITNAIRRRHHRYYHYAKHDRDRGDGHN